MVIYTNNLELTHYHTKKGFYYYIEFIEQSISKKNINLNLTSQDAVMFVYKKTINNFTINHISCKLHNKIKIFLNIYNYLLINHLNYNDFILDKDKKDMIDELFYNIKKINSIKKLTYLSKNIISKNITLIESINLVTNIIKS